MERNDILHPKSPKFDILFYILGIFLYLSLITACIYLFVVTGDNFGIIAAVLIVIVVLYQILRDRIFPHYIGISDNGIIIPNFPFSSPTKIPWDKIIRLSFHKKGICKIIGEYLKLEYYEKGTKIKKIYISPYLQLKNCSILDILKYATKAALDDNLKSLQKTNGKNDF